MNAWWSVALALAACGDNELPEACVPAVAGSPHPVGAMSVVATVPATDDYGEMVVTSSHAYFHARHNAAPYDTLRRTHLSTGITEDVAQLPVEPHLRQFLDLVAWSSSRDVFISSPTNQRAITAPFETPIDSFDFDNHHVFMSAAGALQQTVAVNIDGTSADASWNRFGLDLFIEKPSTAIVVNCGGVWRATVGGSFEPIGDADLCAYAVAGVSGVAVVNGYGACGYALFRVDLETGATTTLVAGGAHEQVDALFLQTDTDDFYYIDATSTLVRVPLAGGDPTQILADARTFALSETAIYAITGSQLVRIAKIP